MLRSLRSEEGEGDQRGVVDVPLLLGPDVGLPDVEVEPEFTPVPEEPDERGEEAEPCDVEPEVFVPVFVVCPEFGPL